MLQLVLLRTMGPRVQGVADVGTTLLVTWKMGDVILAVKLDIRVPCVKVAVSYILITFTT